MDRQCEGRNRTLLRIVFLAPLIRMQISPTPNRVFTRTDSQVAQVQNDALKKTGVSSFARTLLAYRDCITAYIAVSAHKNQRGTVREQPHKAISASHIAKGRDQFSFGVKNSAVNAKEGKKEAYVYRRQAAPFEKLIPSL